MAEKDRSRWQVFEMALGCAFLVDIVTAAIRYWAGHNLGAALVGLFFGAFGSIVFAGFIALSTPGPGEPGD